MTWTSITAPTRRSKPSHEEWKPSDGQSRAVAHLIRNGVAALWADPGAGKTSITLTAFDYLQKAGIAKKMLVMATVRICQLTWRQEAAKWTHTKHLHTVFLHGDKKDKILHDGLTLLPGLGGADIFLINYEGLPWLCEKYKGRGGLPFDTIVSDEITKLKNAQGVRHKALRKVTKNTARKWGLTGTPAPNGYLNLFGQFLWLDGGASLGSFYSHYRDMYFQPGWDGFTYELQKGGMERIHERIREIVFRLEYTDLPAVRNNDIKIPMDAKARKSYDTLRKQELVDIDGITITAGNSAAVFGKLKQMANGAVYKATLPGQPKEWIELHTCKLDALVELIESLNGQPCLIAYQYNHDLERIQKRLKDEFGWDVPYLGAGVTGAAAEKLQDEWNANKHPAMLCQPQSVAHGLNFQQGGAWHIIWFSADWDLENYEQLIRRLRRKGNVAERVMNHRLIIENSIDEEVFSALEDKDVTQARLLQSMRRVLNNEPPPRLAAPDNDTEEVMTIRRLPPQGGAAPPPPPQQAAQPPADKPRVTPKGWGQAASAAQAAPPASPQAGAIQSKLQGAGSYQPPVEEVEEEAGEDVAAAAAAHMNAALGQSIQQGDEAREAARQVNDGEAQAPTPPPPAQASPKRRSSRSGAGEGQRPVSPAAAPVAEAAEAAQTTAYGTGAEVHLSFHGTPDQVAAAMLQFIAAFKNA